MSTEDSSLKRSALFFLVFLTSLITSYSQTIVSGTVRDAISKQPLQSVTVVFKGGGGMTTNENGAYSLTTNNSNITSIQVSYVGYKTQVQNIVPNKQQVIDIDLIVADAKNTVTVKSKRGKYSNKNNPAVDLIRKVIDNKSKNKISSYDFVEYEQYDKMELSLTNKPEKNHGKI